MIQIYAVIRMNVDHPSSVYLTTKEEDAKRMAERSYGDCCHIRYEIYELDSADFSKELWEILNECK